MYVWFLSDSDLTRELIAGRTARADALTRAAYRVVTLAATAVSQVIQLAERAVQSYGHWRRRGAAIRTLRGLDDRLLHDIGVDRSEIWRVADGGAERGPIGLDELARLEAEQQARPEPVDDFRRAA